MKYLIGVVALLALSSSWAEGESTCYGTTSNGRLENGWKLPSSGNNFTAYSLVGRLLGRTYVHSAVGAVVLEAYGALEKELPETVFV